MVNNEIKAKNLADLIKEKPEKLNLGELIYLLIRLKSLYETKRISGDYPYPEDYARYGGIQGYNNKLEEQYEQKTLELISELDKREEVYKIKKHSLSV